MGELASVNTAASPTAPTATITEDAFVELLRSSTLTAISKARVRFPAALEAIATGEQLEPVLGHLLEKLQRSVDGLSGE